VLWLVTVGGLLEIGAPAFCYNSAVPPYASAHRDKEGQGLAGARLGGAQHVAAGQGVRQRGPLHRGQRREFGRRQTHLRAAAARGRQARVTLLTT